MPVQSVIATTGGDSRAVSRFASPAARRVRVVPARLPNRAGGFGAPRLSFD